MWIGSRLKRSFRGRSVFAVCDRWLPPSSGRQRGLWHVRHDDGDQVRRPMHMHTQARASRRWQTGEVANTHEVRWPMHMHTRGGAHMCTCACTCIGHMHMRMHMHWPHVHMRMHMHWPHVHMRMHMRMHMHMHAHAHAKRSSPRPRCCAPRWHTLLRDCVTA